MILKKLCEKYEEWWRWRTTHGPRLQHCSTTHCSCCNMRWWLDCSTAVYLNCRQLLYCNQLLQCPACLAACTMQHQEFINPFCTRGRGHPKPSPLCIDIYDHMGMEQVSTCISKSYNLFVLDFISMAITPPICILHPESYSFIVQYLFEI